MDGNESDMDGSMSNAEEEEEMRESDFDEDIESEANGALRLKMEAMDDEILSRIRKSEREDRDDFERDYKAHNEKLQREVAAAVQRHAAQAVAAAVAAGLPNPTQWATNLPPSVTSPGPLPLSLNNGASVNSSSGINIAPNTSSFISSSSPGGGSGSSGPTSSSSSTGVAQHLEAGKGYTFEEQFKQLYELSDDPKRKEFLDDLFAFMQKRGTPVNRIPIMAKQVLDLFELYRLVVARGGLVEVINKKIWREITKGLNLPSSITSAAFTLRTQYMKYLYQYECEKEHLSSTDELQQAIDGNRREGRRSSYGHYSDMVGATPPPASNAISRNHTSSHHTSPISLVSRHINGHGSQGASSGEEDNTSMSSTINPLLSLSSQSEALNLEVKPNTNNNTSSNLINNLTNNNNRDSINHHDNSGIDLSARTLEMGVPGAKRYLSDGERFLLNAGVPSAHIKLTSRDGRTQMENSLVLSMEINNILYQGVLFARNRMS